MMTVFRTWVFAVVMIVMQSNYYASELDQKINSYSGIIESDFSDKSDLKKAMDTIIQEGFACLQETSSTNCMFFDEERFVAEYSKVFSVFEKYPVGDVIETLQSSFWGITFKSEDKLRFEKQNIITDFIKDELEKNFTKKLLEIEPLIRKLREELYEVILKMVLQNKVYVGYDNESFKPADFELIIHEILAARIVCDKFASDFIDATHLANFDVKQQLKKMFVHKFKINSNYSGEWPQYYWGNAIAIVKNNKKSQLHDTIDADIYTQSCNELIDLFEDIRQSVLSYHLNDSYYFISDTLENKECDVNEISSITGLTPIHTIVSNLIRGLPKSDRYNRYLQIFDELIERGADLNIPHCIDGRTPIFTLIEGGLFKGYQTEHQQIVEHMLDSDCDLTVQDEQGMTPYDYACHLAFDHFSVKTQACAIVDRVGAKQACVIPDIIAAKMGKPSIYGTKMNLHAELLKNHPEITA